MKLKTVFLPFKYLINSIFNAVNHDGIEHAGYLAFLLMLTIFPFLVFFVALIGMIGDVKLADLLVNIILHSGWAHFIDALKPRIIEITSNPPQSFLTIAILSAVWTASSIFEAIRNILNKAYDIKNYPHYIFRRLLSFFEFAVVIIITVMLLVALIIIPNISTYFFDLLRAYDIPLDFLSPETEFLRHIILLLFGFSFVSGLYYFLPNRKQRLLATFPGAITVMIGWYLATTGMSFYIRTFPSINIIYGSIAGIIIALLYFYVCAFVFIVGAELNCQIERSRDEEP